MLKNYWKIAFRNLWRRKGFSFINITGLTIGMASATLILLWIHNEISYDDFHPNKDRIYQAWNRTTANGRTTYWQGTPRALGPALLKEYSGIANTARMDNRWFVTAVGEKKMSSHSLIIDPSFLSIFHFPLVRGNAATALDNSSSIVITESFAKKLFGNANGFGCGTVTVRRSRKYDFFHRLFFFTINIISINFGSVRIHHNA